MPFNNINNYLIQLFTNSDFVVFENEGSRFLINSQSGKEYQIDVRVLDLTVPQRDKKIKIPKSDWNYELPDNLHVALVVMLEGIEPAIYLIPTKVFTEPDNYIFFDNEQPERFKHFSNWVIKVFGKGIEKLSEYAFDRVVGELNK